MQNNSVIEAANSVLETIISDGISHVISVDYSHLIVTIDQVPYKIHTSRELNLLANYLASI